LNVFYGLHPLTGFIWFAFVLAFSMTTDHPVLLGISLLCGYAWFLKLKKGRGLKSLLYMLPLFLLTAAMNPLFSHEGATILYWMKSGNPMTLESIVYGIAAGAMLVCLVSWFGCFGEMMTSDKLIWLFGRFIPHLSVLISMALRFVPRFTKKIGEFYRVRKSLCPEKKLSGALHSFSAAVTWALENAVETADSMRSRGYGLKGRTAFSIYRFTRRDAGFTALTLVFGITVLALRLAGLAEWMYYPVLMGELFSPYAFAVYIPYFLLCALPIIYDITEALKWKAILSKI